MNKKKVGATVATLGVAAAVLLTGTYAWQSLNQEAINEASGIVNPGGRLHDDFDYNNDVKRIYVENFGDRNIYARIQLTEYMELGVDAGTKFDSTETRNVELVTADASYSNTATWSIHYYDSDNVTDEYWNLDFGGDAVEYLPTFNMNKDSLSADINGTYVNNYSDYESYDGRFGEEITGTEIRDIDTDTRDEEREDGQAVVGEDISETTNISHTVSKTKASCVMSMDEWNALDTIAELEAEGVTVDETTKTKDNTACWVYDVDGWAYWSQPIASGTATGTLINDIDVKNVDDNWFYALNATAQFITADDLGRNDGTGFYDLDKGSEPSKDALNLLQTIGVDTTLVVDFTLDEDLAVQSVVDMMPNTETDDDPYLEAFSAMYYGEDASYGEPTIKFTKTENGVTEYVSDEYYSVIDQFGVSEGGIDRPTNYISLMIEPGTTSGTIYTLYVTYEGEDGTVYGNSVEYVYTDDEITAGGNVVVTDTAAEYTTDSAISITSSDHITGIAKKIIIEKADDSIQPEFTVTITTDNGTSTENCFVGTALDEMGNVVTYGYLINKDLMTETQFTVTVTYVGNDGTVYGNSQVIQ